MLSKCLKSRFVIRVIVVIIVLVISVLVISVLAIKEGAATAKPNLVNCACLKQHISSSPSPQSHL